MVCLPQKDPNQYDLFNENINFPASPSVAYPPNMQDIMDELAKPGAIKPSPNIELIDQLEALLDTNPDISGLPIENQQLILGTYSFGSDPRFNFATGTYDARFPPLLDDTGGIRDVLNVLRTHLAGIPTTVPGVLGSLGQANALRTMGYVGSGNSLQQSLGLGAIPDCGLVDSLLASLIKLLQPLIDLLAKLLDPLFNMILAILALMAAIIQELLALINLVEKLLNFASAGQLLRLDPCALLVMSQIGSQALNQQVNEGITWRDPNAPQIPEPGTVY